MPVGEDKKVEPALKSEKLQFIYLPAYAGFLLNNRLVQFVTYNLHTAREANFHLMKYFDFMDDEKIIEISKVSTTAFLTAFIENSIDDYIIASTEKWKANQLPLIARDQIVAEDIALTSMLRKKGFVKFLPEYTQDIELCLNIIRELDDYTFRQQSIGFQTFIDIQQERLNELNANLQKSEAQLLEAQQLGNVGSFDWDLVGSETYFTPQLTSIFGIDKPVKFSAFLDYIHPHDREKLKAAMDAAMQGDGLYECEYRYQKDGKEKVVWSRGIVSFLNGRPYKMRGTVMDMTERYKIVAQLADLNASLEHKNAELERSNKELTSFGYVASHDLQEPLRNIKIFCNMIVEKEGEILSDKGKHLLSRVIAATGKMQRLIDDLLTFSRTQTYTDDIAPVDLNVILGEIKAMYADQINEREMEISSGPLPVVNGIAFQLRQLFDNIFTNSVKYKKPEGPLVITLRSEVVSGYSIVAEGGDAQQSYYRIEVSDNGIGFEQKYAEKIFEIFQRLHGKDEYSGTGIGLAICKRIAQNHNGVIYATGVLDEGATFYICLPA